MGAPFCRTQPGSFWYWDGVLQRSRHESVGIPTALGYSFYPRVTLWRLEFSRSRRVPPCSPKMRKQGAHFTRCEGVRGCQGRGHCACGLAVSGSRQATRAENL